MSSSQKIYTQEISWLLDLKQDLRRKLSYMLSSTGLEILKSEISLEEAQQMVLNLKKDSSETHLLLDVYENEWCRLLGEAISKDSMVDDSLLDQNTLH